MSSDGVVGHRYALNNRVNPTLPSLRFGRARLLRIFVILSIFQG